MSAHTDHDHDSAQHAHDHHDDEHGHDDSVASHSTLSGYVTGFILAVFLTAIPFWLVMGKVFVSNSTTALVLMAFAAAQIVVHMIYFLHMNTRSEGGWSFMALMFTLLIVGIALAGSLWVMSHMNATSMPMSIPEMTNMPWAGARLHSTHGKPRAALHVCPRRAGPHRRPAGGRLRGAGPGRPGGRWLCCRERSKARRCGRRVLTPCASTN